MDNFKKINPEALNENIFNLIGKDWALITTKKPEGGYNTMTASWGGAGVLWNKPVVFVFIRPQRYTYELMENQESFTLSFLNESFREKLGYCGKVSGRDEDKIKKCGFNIIPTENGGFINEAKVAITCRKLYFGDILESGFADPALLSNYPSKDYHRMYVGEITSVYLESPTI